VDAWRETLPERVFNKSVYCCIVDWDYTSLYETIPPDSMPQFISMLLNEDLLH
jgi:hypothetical protein